MAVAGYAQHAAWPGHGLNAGMLQGYMGRVSSYLPSSLQQNHRDDSLQPHEPRDIKCFKGVPQFSYHPFTACTTG